MTTLVVTVSATTDTTPVTSIARTFTHENIEARAGMPRTEPLPFVVNVTDDSLISLLSGVILSEDSWVMTITMKPNV